MTSKVLFVLCTIALIMAYVISIASVLINGCLSDSCILAVMVLTILACTVSVYEISHV